MGEGGEPPSSVAKRIVGPSEGAVADMVVGGGISGCDAVGGVDGGWKVSMCW